MKLKFRISVSVLLLILPLGLLLSQNTPKDYSQRDKAYFGISAHEIYNWVDYLSSDEFKGRLCGSAEYTKCAHWAAIRFAAWGLAPGGDNGYYFQNFPIQYTCVEGNPSLKIISEDLKNTYTVGKDYYPGTHTDSGLLKGDVVYVGYGISAPDMKYHDYAGIDVKGKIVVFEPGVPCAKDNPNYELWSERYSATLPKFENAIMHGAAGIMMLGNSPHPGVKFNKGIVYCHISDRVLNDLLLASGNTASKLRKSIAEQCKANSFVIKGAQIEMEFNSIHAALSQTQNVIAYIPGSDPKLKDSPIIIGAHLDHLGAPGVVFPGALDNASGSAIVMATAKAFATSGIKPLRPIVFILFGAEEPGMLGSKFYVKNPLFPLSKTLCMFNLDMVGNGSSLRVSGAASFPSLEKILQASNDKYLKRILSTSEYEKASGRMYTDGEIFSFNDVPAFSFGVRHRLSRTYYHVPEDTIITLTPDIMADVSKLLFLSLAQISMNGNFKLKHKEK